jgi:hypothetical protein
MYFSQFPRIYYDFPTVDGKDTTLQALTDITVNIRVRKEILENITLYDEYDIKEGETPEIIAEKYYGNPELHWTIMLANERYDYHNDFPLSTQELYENAIAKYGKDNLDQVHHYKKDGLIVQGQGLLSVSSEVYQSIIPKSDIIQNLNLFAQIIGKVVTNTGPKAIILLEKGKFIAGQDISILGIRVNEVTRVSEFVGITAYTLPNNPFELSTGYFAITNIQHEEIENEKKRRIKLISPLLIQQVVKELKDLIG